jgi:RNA recognition motif-containing protein
VIESIFFYPHRNPEMGKRKRDNGSEEVDRKKRVKENEDSEANKLKIQKKERKKAKKLKKQLSKGKVITKGVPSNDSTSSVSDLFSKSEFTAVIDAESLPKASRPKKKSVKHNDKTKGEDVVAARVTAEPGVGDLFANQSFTITPAAAAEAAEAVLADSKAEKAKKIESGDLKRRPGWDREKRANERLQRRRTIFVGNVSLSTKGKALKRLFSEAGKVESVRFRSVAVEATKVSKGSRNLIKRAAFNSGRIDASRNTANAYVVFADETAVSAALAMNNRVLNDHHLRVDSVSGEKAKQHDYKQCVFVGHIKHSVEEEEVGFFLIFYSYRDFLRSSVSFLSRILWVGQIALLG